MPRASHHQPILCRYLLLLALLDDGIAPPASLLSRQP